MNTTPIVPKTGKTTLSLSSRLFSHYAIRTVIKFVSYCFSLESSYVRDGVLHIRPTLTADRFGEDFLYNGTLDLWPEGCNVNYNGGCVTYMRIFFPVDIYSNARLYIRVSLLECCCDPSSGRPGKTSSTPFNPPGCALSTRSALLTARLRYALKCPAAIGFGLVQSHIFLTHKSK